VSANPLPTLPARPRSVPPPMTRCECAGVTFVEVAYRMQYEGQTLPEVMERTGCGQTCTACLPDLRSFLREKGLL